MREADNLDPLHEGDEYYNNACDSDEELVLRGESYPRDGETTSRPYYE